MATFRYISPRGDSLLLTNGENFELVNIDNQTYVAANISSMVVGGVDGDKVNNVQAQPRTIVLDLKILSNVEQTKRKILSVFKVKQKGTLVWKQEDTELKIQGVIESIEMPRWTNSVICQISLHCEQPYWEDMEQIVTEISAAIDKHYFTDFVNDMLIFTDEGIVFGEYDTTRTKDFHNAGDVDIGMEIEIVAYRTVTNPILYNQDNEFFGVGHGTGNKQVVMNIGDVIRINTSKNEKAVTLNGVSIIDKVKPQSTWLQLLAGDNTLSINSDDLTLDNMTFSIAFTQRYI